MLPNRADIIKKLRLEINTLNGFKQLRNSCLSSRVLGPINNAFPNENFPLACLHEIDCGDASDRSAAIGFISVVLSSFLHNGAVCWISRKERIFPPAFRKFSIDPSHLIFIRPKNQKDFLWTLEESLKCRGLSAVVGEMPEMDFTVSRRFQLALEESRVTAFIIREGSGLKINTASTARWKISHLPSAVENDLPGIGFPRWKVQLEKLRNGKAACWDLLYKKGKLEEFNMATESVEELERKTG